MVLFVSVVKRAEQKKKAEMRSNEERERGVSTHAVTFFKFIKGKRKTSKVERKKIKTAPLKY